MQYNLSEMTYKDHCRFIHTWAAATLVQEHPTLPPETLAEMVPSRAASLAKFLRYHVNENKTHLVETVKTLQATEGRVDLVVIIS